MAIAIVLGVWAVASLLLGLFLGWIMRPSRGCWFPPEIINAPAQWPGDSAELEEGRNEGSEIVPAGPGTVELDRR